MNTSTTFQEIAAEIQLFDNIEQKEQFIFVVGALVSRRINRNRFFLSY